MTLFLQATKALGTGNTLMTLDPKFCHLSLCLADIIPVVVNEIHL